MYPPELPRRKAREFAARPRREGWGALSALWATAFVQAGPALNRWAARRRPTEEGLALAITYAAGLSYADDIPIDLVIDLEEFEIEDDGSFEWQRLVDLTGMLADCLAGKPLDVCAERALTWFLDGRMNELGDELGARSASALRDLVAEDARWQRTLAWVDAL
jgi:hypothetical protein